MDEIQKGIQELKQEISKFEKRESGEKIWWCKKCGYRFWTEEDKGECPKCYGEMVIESNIWENLKLKKNISLTALDKMLISKLLKNETLDNPENVFKLINFLRKFIEGEEIGGLINDFRNKITLSKSNKQNFLEAIKISEKTGEYHRELSEKYFRAEHLCLDLATQYFIHSSEILEKLGFNFEDDDLAFNNFDDLNLPSGGSVDEER